MTDIRTSDDRFEFGRVVGRTFSLIGKNFVLFLLLSLILVGAPQFGVQYVQAYVAQARPDLIVWMSIAAIVISLVSTYILQGSLTRASVDDLSGRGVNLGGALGAGLANFFPLFVVALLVGLGTFVGVLLFVIPGLMLAVRWVVAAPVMVIERTGPTNAMGRSGDLSEGHRWAIFGLLVLYIIFAYAVQFALILGLNALGISFTERLSLETGGLIFAGANAATTALVTLVSTVGSAALYFELRQVKDGVGVDELAKVFD